MMNAGSKEGVDIRDIIRDLQRKFDKSKPIMTLVERGELKVLSEAEERIVNLYPKWIEALEEARQGRLPVLFGGKALSPPSPPPQAVSLTQQPQDQQPQHLICTAHSATVDVEAGSPDLEAVFRSIAEEMKSKEGPKARKAFLEAKVKSLVSLKELTAAKRDFDKVSELRSDIRSGKIDKPSKGQLAKIQLFDQMKQQVQYHKDLVREQEEIIRTRVTESLRELELAAAQATATPVVDETSSPAAAESFHREEGNTSSEPAVQGSSEETAVEQQNASVTEEASPSTFQNVSPPRAIDASTAVEVPSDENGAAESDNDEEDDDEPSAPIDDGDDDDMFGGFGAVFSVAKQKKRAKEEKLAESEVKVTPLAPTAATTAEVAEETVTDAQETEADALEDAVPAGPKEIDWSELRYKKFRPKLVFVDPATISTMPTPPPQAEVAPTVKSEKVVVEKPTFLALQVGSGRFALESQADGVRNGGGVVKKSAPKAVKLPVQSPVFHDVLQSVRTRVDKEFAAIDKLQLESTSGFPTLAVSPVANGAVSDSRPQIVWAVNVSPASGPLCGVIVPLRMKFSEHYPFEAPEVTSSVDFPHPNVTIAATGGASQREFRLCFEHTGPKDWDPAAGAHSILMQLQTFFSSESFERTRKSASNFNSRIQQARIECSRFVANDGTGHTPERPVPDVALRNGPFTVVKGSAPAVSVDGRMKGAAVLEWVHTYTHRTSSDASSTHTILLHVHAVGPRGVSIELMPVTESTDTASPAASFSVKERTLTTPSGCTTLSNASDGSPTPLAAGETFSIVIEMSPSKTRLTVASRKYQSEVQNDLSGNVSEIRPIISLLDAATEISVAFSLSSAAPKDLFAEPAPETCAAPALPEDPQQAGCASEPCCFLTQRTSSESVLGLHVEVLKRNAASIPTEVRCSFGEYICPSALDQVRQRRVLHDRRIDGMIPLLMGPEALSHPTNGAAVKELKIQLTRLARNPNASTLYEAPFRPISAAVILPAAMNDATRHLCSLLFGESDESQKPSLSIVDPAVVAQKRAAFRRCVCEQYCPLLLALVALEAQNPAAMQDSLKQQLTSDQTLISSGHVFAWSHFLNSPWPDVVRTAFRADAPDFARKTSATVRANRKGLAAGGMNRNKCQAFIVSAVLARTFRTTSIQKLQDDLKSLTQDHRMAASNEFIQGSFDTLIAASAKNLTLDGLEELVGASVIERHEE